VSKIKEIAMSPPIDRMLHPSMSIRFQFLFVALLLMLSGPVFLPDRLVALALPVLFTVVAFAALTTAVRNRNTLVLGVLLGVPAILLHWIARSEEVPLVGEVSGVLFLLWVTLNVLAHTLRAKRVTTETLFAAASVYLLFALIWAMGYGIADLLQPGALSFPDTLLAHAEDPSTRGLFSYFSFVTLTTLGYGDIAPVSDAARTMAMLEATLGQLFVVIVVARLVGMHTAQYMETLRATDAPE
jgi:hypothetical protein